MALCEGIGAHTFEGQKIEKTFRGITENTLQLLVTQASTRVAERFEIYRDYQHAKQQYDSLSFHEAKLS